MIIGRFPPRYLAFTDEKLSDVIKGLNFRGVRYAPAIGRDGKYVGLIRLLDVIGFLRKHLVSGDIRGFLGSESSTIVSKVPSLPLENISLEHIVTIMKEYNVGGIAITSESGEVVGEVTENHLIDLFSHTRKYGVPVKAVMTPSPVTVKADDTLESALILMIEEKARRLPVVYQDELVGVLTIRDIIRFLANKIDSGLKKEDLTTPVWFVSTPKPVIIEENADCSEAVSLIRSEGIGGLLVVDEKGFLTGIVSERDLLFRLPFVADLSIRSYLFEPYKQYLGL